MVGCFAYAVSEHCSLFTPVSQHEEQIQLSGTGSYLGRTLEAHLRRRLLLEGTESGRWPSSRSRPSAGVEGSSHWNRGPLPDEMPRGSKMYRRKLARVIRYPLGDTGGGKPSSVVRSSEVVRGVGSGPENLGCQGKSSALAIASVFWFHCLRSQSVPDCQFETRAKRDSTFVEENKQNFEFIGWIGYM